MCLQFKTIQIKFCGGSNTKNVDRKIQEQKTGRSERQKDKPTTSTRDLFLGPGTSRFTNNSQCLILKAVFDSTLKVVYLKAVKSCLNFSFNHGCQIKEEHSLTYCFYNSVVYNRDMNPSYVWHFGSSGNTSVALDEVHGHVVHLEGGASISNATERGLVVDTNGGWLSLKQTNSE